MSIKKSLEIMTRYADLLEYKRCRGLCNRELINQLESLSKYAIIEDEHSSEVQGYGEIEYEGESIYWWVDGSETCWTTDRPDGWEIWHHRT